MGVLVLLVLSGLGLMVKFVCFVCLWEGNILVIVGLLVVCVGMGLLGW